MTWLGWAYLKERRYPEAIAEREKVAQLWFAAWWTGLRLCDVGPSR
jgi:hypothetical protein